MAGCASCLHKNVHPNVCSACLGGTHFKPRNKTKADCIRSMTDEELADFIARQRFSAVNQLADKLGVDLTAAFIVGRKNTLDWLRKEAMNDGDSIR